ncbi:MAG: Starch binding domain [Pseudomonadota bacterium]
MAVALASVGGARHVGEPAGGVSATIVAPAGTVFAYKLVRRGPDGAVTWEERGDRYALLNEDAVVEAYWAR